METGAERTASAERTRGQVGRYRYLVVTVIWLTFCVGAFDRANISLLLVDHGFLRDMGLVGSPEKQGLVMSMLLLPYALSNIFLSPAADRWGPRRVLSLMAVLWAAVALFLGSVWSYWALLAGRLARGTAEGPLYPIANRYVRNWFPSSERGGANAIWTTGQRMGLALSVPILTVAIAAFGWRFSFFLQAALIAVVVVPAIWLLTADRPEQMPRVGKAERAHIARGEPGQTANPVGERELLRLLLRNYRFWLAVIYHFAMLAVYFGLLTWLPKYLREARGFDVAQMVFFASFPHVLSTVTALSFGFLSDRIGRRALFCSAGMAGTGIAVCLAAVAPDPVASALLIVLGIGLWGIIAPGYYAIMQRIIPGPIMATGIGVDNGLSNFGSAMAPAAVGFLIGATGSYLAGLLFLGAIALLGAMSAAVLAVQRY